MPRHWPENDCKTREKIFNARGCLKIPNQRHSFAPLCEGWATANTIANSQVQADRNEDTNGPTVRTSAYPMAEWPCVCSAVCSPLHSQERSLTWSRLHPARLGISRREKLERGAPLVLPVWVGFTERFTFAHVASVGNCSHAISRVTAVTRAPRMNSAKILKMGYTYPKTKHPPEANLRSLESSIV